MNLARLGIAPHVIGPMFIVSAECDHSTTSEHARRITGYATSIGCFGHAVGESNGELKTLIRRGHSFFRARVLATDPQRELLRRSLGNGLRVVQPR